MRYLIVAEADRDLEQLSSRLALTGPLAVLVADTPSGGSQPAWPLPIRWPGR